MYLYESFTAYSAAIAVINHHFNACSAAVPRMISDYCILSPKKKRKFSKDVQPTKNFVGNTQILHCPAV